MIETIRGVVKFLRNMDMFDYELRPQHVILFVAALVSFMLFQTGYYLIDGGLLTAFESYVVSSLAVCFFGAFTYIGMFKLRYYAWVAWVLILLGFYNEWLTVLGSLFYMVCVILHLLFDLGREDLGRARHAQPQTKRGVRK